MRPTTPSPHPAILVLEDEPDIRTLVADVLREAGYLPVPAATEAEGRAFLASFRIDLAIADPPTADCASLDRLLAAAGDTPVVVCTARARHDDTWLLRGFAGILPKPFDLDELLATVAAHVGPHGNGGTP